MRTALLLLLAAPLPILADAPDAHAVPKAVTAFVQNHCVDCHSGDEPEANLDLDSLSARLTDPSAMRTWVDVFDRVHAGEMPPADALQPAADERSAALDALRQSLTLANRHAQATYGRTRLRRLNRVEYENTLRDLLKLPELDVKEMLPADASAHGFDNVGAALELSSVQMSRYLDAADEALRQAIATTERPTHLDVRLAALTNGRLMQVVKKREEAIPIGEAVGLLRQPNTAQAPWWWSKLFVPADGSYTLRMKCFGFVWDKGTVLPADRNHVVTYLAVQGSTKRPIGRFDVGPSAEEPTVHEFQAHLKRGDSIEVWFDTLDDRNKGRTPLNEYTAPGVALEFLEVSGPHLASWPPPSHVSLFGELPYEPWTAASNLNAPPLPIMVQGVGKRAKAERAKPNKVTLHHVVSTDPRADAERLLTDFANRAFRRPVAEGELDDILALVDDRLARKETFQEALRIGFQAILCSPEFLFLQERPGDLGPHALANRLSYFLWSSCPDERLRSLADSGEILKSDVLRSETERLLSDSKSRRFVENFTGQWLDLRRITITQPDEQLYPEFDTLLLASMVEETHGWFAKMLREDLPVDAVVDSDVLLINQRLAEHYGLDSEVTGVTLREVPIPESSVRGGLLTQAALLKVTANGTTTSPVTRGAWVVDRLLGQPPRLPPPNVAAVEPDLRGAVTIREQLAKHRDIESCAACHRSIDPPGFALESFDVIGGYRDRYRSLGKGEPARRTFKNDRPVRYKLGLPVDASGVAPSGAKFDDIEEFRSILLSDREQLARNLAERLTVYATGAGIEFADRPQINMVLKETQDADYGLRSLVHAIVQSPTFRRK